MYCAICFTHYPGSNHFWDVLSCCLTSGIEKLKPMANLFKYFDGALCD